MQQTFKYYKRGKGELDTSNFPQLLSQDSIVVDRLDSKTFVSILALDRYAGQQAVSNGWRKSTPIYIKGYVDHMRGDKDLFSVSQLYDTVQNFYFRSLGVQHESTLSISSGVVTKEQILKDLNLDCGVKDVLFIGADGSVSKFFPEVDICASKVRTEGKVVSLELDSIDLEGWEHTVIVDDLLGGGATVKQLRENLGNIWGSIHCWFAYNEGIHPASLLDSFETAYLGDTV